MMRGAIEGLRRTWDAGFRKVILQLDSKAAMTILTTGEEIGTLYALEKASFKELQDRNCDLVVRRTYREGNQAADFLASIAYDYPYGSHSVLSSDCNL
ncbi:hypothetical protein LINPERPRIM_LOCUS38051 [Linum perenne]